MVSNARLDLPDPDSPVTTIIRSRGSSTETSRRLWTRAPWTAIVVRGPGRPAIVLRGPGRSAALAITRLRGEERQLFDGDVAPLVQQDRRGRLADQAEVRQVFARGGHAAHIEGLLEVILDVAARPDVAVLAQVGDHRREDLRRARLHELLRRGQ